VQLGFVVALAVSHFILFYSFYILWFYCGYMVIYVQTRAVEALTFLMH